MTVLLVDDDRRARDATRRVLEAAGARVMTASDGGHALEMRRVLRPDLVVTDLAMPGLDGVGLVRAIRGDPRLASLLVVVLTAGDRSTPMTGIRDAGFDGHLTKPVSAAQLAPYVGAARAARRWSRRPGPALGATGAS